jgi:hypothetical protein
MNSPLLQEHLLLHDTTQTPLPLATAGVERYVWEGKFGHMLIEVIDGMVFVNGQRVEPIASDMKVRYGA